MLDHVSLGITDLERSRRFYDAALRPLGLVRIVDFQQRGSDYGAMAGSLGVEFTITREVNLSVPFQGMHVCFRAPDRAAVRAFHTAGVASGGTSDGEPGPRLAYHPDYFAAFVLDPDGHRIEAVCHAPLAPSVVQLRAV
jgi:catechol 2,3-dioxygenase-like lactoylglutathione lyase family enzyme